MGRVALPIHRSPKVTAITIESDDVQAPVEAVSVPTARRGRAFIHRTILSTIGVLLALIFWQLLADQQGFALPSPVDAWRDISENLFSSTYLEQKGLSDGGGYTVHLLATTRNVLVGVTLGRGARRVNRPLEPEAPVALRSREPTRGCVRCGPYLWPLPSS